MWRKVALSLFAIAISSSIAIAGQSGVKYKRHHNDHNYWHGRHHNNQFYNNPYFWGGVAGGIAGGLIGGAIIQGPREYYYVEPECQTVWINVYIPGYGYQRQRTLACN